MNILLWHLVLGWTQTGEWLFVSGANTRVYRFEDHEMGILCYVIPERTDSNGKAYSPSLSCVKK